MRKTHGAAFGILGVCFSLAISASGFCSGIVAPSSSPTVSQNPLVPILAPDVRTLSHSVWVYHWVSRLDYKVANIPASGPVSSEANMNPYIKLMVGLFENTTYEQNGFLGNGLYVATDPVASQKIGNFGLLQITFPKGMRYLNTRDGYYTTNINSCSANLFKSTGECRKLLLQALKALKIDVVSYAYNARKPTECDNWSDAAFVITSSALENARTRFFVNEIPADEIHSLDRAFINTYVKKEGSGPIWNSPDVVDEPLGYHEYLKENLFGCSSKYPEAGK